MVTTIQINDKTLMLLKKLKEELKAASYDEAIIKMAAARKRRSLAGSLKKYYIKKSVGEVVNEIQKERRASDRF